MTVASGIWLKLLAVALFAVMSALVRYAGQTVPLGQLIFFRSAFAILAISLFYAWRGELKKAVYTERPFGHLGRGMLSVVGMFLGFAALTNLPLVDSTAIQFAGPFITVVLSAWLLGERVRVYRWSAVLIGFAGVIVMLWPYLNLTGRPDAVKATATIGAMCAFASCFTNAMSTIQTRRLTDSEHTASIVFYFSLSAGVAGLLTLPFFWHSVTMSELWALVGVGLIGGIAHIILTESFRRAPASVVAPFDYTGILWALLFGYVFFSELPTLYAYIGAAIVIATGLFVIWRERQLGLERVRTSAVAGPVAD